MVLGGHMSLVRTFKRYGFTVSPWGELSYNDIEMIESVGVLEHEYPADALPDKIVKDMIQAYDIKVD